MPVAPQECIQIPLAEPLDRLGELTLERQAPHLAVGDHGEPGILLQADGRVDRRILDTLELGRTDLAELQAPARRQQLGRPQQAADDVGARFDHSPSLRVLARVEQPV